MIKEQNNNQKGQQNLIENDQNKKQQQSANTQPSFDLKIKLQKFENYDEPRQGINNQNRIIQEVRNNHLENPKPIRRRLSHIQRLQDVRLVANTFIQYGLNFRRFSQAYPQIESKFYRNTVQAVNNTAINEMQKFLRYQCNIQIEKLNRDQKRSIRTQLTRVRQWLGKKDMAQLQTLYKFIQRKYELLDVSISIQEAIKLYKTILQIVKSPFVDVMQDDIKPQELDPEAGRLLNKNQKQNQFKTLIFLYIQHKNLTKVSDILCQKFGYDLKWSKHAVKQKIKHILKSSTKKLIGTVQAYDKSLKLFFSQSKQCIDLLLKSQKSLNLRFFLLGFYLQKTITLIELRQYVKNMNKFFISQYNNHGQYQCKKYEQDKIIIPKLEQNKLQKQYYQTQNQQNYSQSQILKRKQDKVKIQQNAEIQLNDEKNTEDQKDEGAVLNFDDIIEEKLINAEQLKIKQQK